VRTVIFAPSRIVIWWSFSSLTPGTGAWLAVMFFLVTEMKSRRVVMSPNMPMSKACPPMDSSTCVACQCVFEGGLTGVVVPLPILECYRSASASL
jgi:hypothetical protein